MENEFQAEVCGGSWWNPARSMIGSSPCSSEFGGFGLIWPSHDNLLDNMKTMSGDESTGSESDGSSSIAIQDHHHNWNINPANFPHERSETTNYPPPILQEHHNSSTNYGQETGVDSGFGDPINVQEDWTIKNFSDQDLSLEEAQKPLNSSTGFPISSVSYGYNSTLLQTLFDPFPQPQLSNLYGNGSSINYIPADNSTNYLAPALNDFRPNLKSSNEEVQGLDTVAKKTNNSEQAFKRPRIETPSPLPTFKVRKEKLGDRVTALQQLVSPFGKTDTASVLHEAIQCIKFLHDQVRVLSTPYLRNGSPIQQRQQTCHIKTKDEEGVKQDLKSRGLCLVPISSTFPIAAETTTDFWTPTFGGTFR